MKAHFVAFLVISSKLLSQSDDYTLTIHQPRTPWKLSDSLTLEVWKYYLCYPCSNESPTNKCHIIESDTTIHNPLQIPNSYKFSISLGIDSLKQSNPNFIEDLSPEKNMYWTWHNGYIQLKAEGYKILPSGEKENFVLHLGGYRIHRTDVCLEGSATQKTMHLQWNEKELSHILMLNPKSNIMSESKEAKLLLYEIANCIVLE